MPRSQCTFAQFAGLEIMNTTRPANIIQVSVEIAATGVFRMMQQIALAVR
jgi:hypothetical protein